MRLPRADESGSSCPHERTLQPSRVCRTRIQLIPNSSQRQVLDLNLNFSLWDENQSCFKPIATNEPDTLVNTLIARYQCFLTAGLVVVFHRIGEPYPFGADFIGIRGSSETPNIPSDVENDLRPCHISALSTLEYIFNIITAASHILSYPFQLVFKIEPMNVSSFNTLVETLPERMGDLNIDT